MKPISLLSHHRSLIGTTARSLDEFIDISTNYGPLIRKRLNEVRLPAEVQLYLSDYPDQLHWLVVAATDDPDTVAVLPVLAHMAAATPRIDLHILTDEDNVAALDEIVDDVDLSGEILELDLPLLLVFDEAWEYQESWGPRPEAAEPYLDGWLELHPEYEALASEEEAAAQEAYAALLGELTHEMRIWYNTALNKACALEIQTLLEGLRAEESE